MGVLGGRTTDRSLERVARVGPSSYSCRRRAAVHRSSVLGVVVMFLRVPTRRMLCAPVLALLALALAAAGSARAAGVFSVQSGGNGHGIGVRQEGADRYAQHGKD